MISSSFCVIVALIGRIVWYQIIICYVCICNVIKIALNCFDILFCFNFASFFGLSGLFN